MALCIIYYIITAYLVILIIQHVDRLVSRLYAAISANIDHFIEMLSARLLKCVKMLLIDDCTEFTLPLWRIIKISS